MKEGFVIRFLIVALPAGLLFGGVFSIYVSQQDKKEVVVDPNEAVRLDAAAINRRPVNREDLAAALSVLRERVGRRNLKHPGGLAKAAVWIESTLGGGNIGYVVERKEIETEQGAVRTLVAELPGRERRDEIIVVGAPYDTPGESDDGGGSVAALLSLARSMAGSPQGRTVRFVAFVRGFGNEAGDTGMDAGRLSSREKVVAVLQIESLGESGNPPGWDKILDEADTSLAFIGNEQARYFVDSAKTAFLKKSDLAVEGIVSGFEGPMEVSAFIPGRPVVFVLDTDVAGDDRNTIDPGRLESVTRGLEAVVRAWANR